MGFGGFFRFRLWFHVGIQAMSGADLALLVGYLVSAWALGFTGGYTITKFIHAVSQVG